MQKDGKLKLIMIRLKNKMELENYGGKLEITISQDFYSSILCF